jgi:heme-degrading monooxygenase HmoA
VQDILIRIETDDFAAWEKQHYLHAANRATFGIHDGPAYRDLENPNAALFHIRVENMDRAMEWFESDTFRAATKLAKVTGRSFYEAHPRAGN